MSRTESGLVAAEAAGRIWTLERPGDLETFWDAMDDETATDDEIPYWVELWPASLAVAGWQERNRSELKGKRCLDLGCGLGLTACIGTGYGARVTAMDYMHDALCYTRINARRNRVPLPDVVRMDWTRPAFAGRVFDVVWGGDVFYEHRFFTPIERLLRSSLAPGGRAIFGDPRRTVSEGVWGRFMTLGWQVRNLGEEQIPFGSGAMTVRVWELRRQ
ncbi:MAG TPA: methyltransferase domain-containing protein [Desulfomicrobiaceae bacterium]|nr:methyltransferase domain-containing protein [Desulfomicrobiaceae bacterium]